MALNRGLRQALTKERDICFFFRSLINIDENVNPGLILQLHNAINRLLDCLCYRNVQFVKDNQIR